MCCFQVNSDVTLQFGHIITSSYRALMGFPSMRFFVLPEVGEPHEAFCAAPAVETWFVLMFCHMRLEFASESEFFLAILAFHTTFFMFVHMSIQCIRGHTEFFCRLSIVPAGASLCGVCSILFVY